MERKDDNSIEQELTKNDVTMRGVFLYAYEHDKEVFMYNEEARSKEKNVVVPGDVLVGSTAVSIGVNGLEIVDNVGCENCSG